MIVETSSVNFELKSDKGTRLFYLIIFKLFNSLALPFNLIRVREVDVAGYCRTNCAKERKSKKRLSTESN